MASTAPGEFMDESLLFSPAPGIITPTESDSETESFSGIDGYRPSALRASSRVPPLPVAPLPAASLPAAPLPAAPAPVAPANLFTFWGLLRGAAVNLLVPFLNGMMLGFGELFAYGFASRYGWSWSTIFPFLRTSPRATPGVDIEAPRHLVTFNADERVFPGHPAAYSPAPDISPSGGSHL